MPMCREININFDCYDINENGTIISKYWNKQLNGCPDKDGYNEWCINECCKGTQKTHKGYIWSYQ